MTAFRLPVLPPRHPHDREILRLAVPAFGALVAEPLFLLADSAIVGNLGTPQLAGLAIAATVLATAVHLCIFLAYGTTAAVARSLGAGDLRGALRLGIDGLWLALLLGVFLGVIGIVSASFVSGWFTDDSAVAGYSTTYLRISMFGLPGMLGVLAMTGILRGLQDTATPLKVAVAANLGNVLLDYVLVYPLGMGIGGSALATIIAQWLSLAVYMAVVLKAVRLEGVSLALSWTGVTRSFRASSPLLIRNLSMRTVVIVSTAVAARIGSPELAAHQVAFTVWTTLSLGLDAVAIAGQAIIGRLLGAADAVGARAAVRRMVELSIGLGVVLGLLIFAGRDLIPPIFSADPEVRRLLSDALLIIALVQPVAGWVFALDGILIGAGDNRYIAAAQAVTVAVFVPLAIGVLVFDLGLTGLWWALAGWLLVRFVLMLRRQLSGTWAVEGATRP
ncbi:MAG TPA: MATE family efflux transporter [Dehalococcoidia bacterium]|nr:MATE family efflux transporter [Dehalococcoidia bacterium]